MALDASIPLQGMNGQGGTLGDMIGLADQMGQYQYNRQLRGVNMQQQQQALQQKQQEAMLKQREAEAQERAKQSFDRITKNYVRQTGKYDPMGIMAALAQEDPEAASIYQNGMAEYGNQITPYMKEINDLEKNRITLLGNMASGVTDEKTYNGLKWAANQLGLSDIVDLPSDYDPSQINAIVSGVINDLERRKTAIDEMNARTQAYRATLEEKRIEKMESTPKTPDQGKPLSGEAAKTLGLVSSGIEGAQTFLTALQNGDDTFWATTALGGLANPEASIAFEKMTESLGRLNSGGAINKDEEKRFKRLLASKKNLATSEGRKAVISELQRFINRGKTTGDLIYGGQGWQSKFGFADNKPAQSQAPSFTSESEAEAANLPAGTIIYINGRKAVVE